MQKAVAAANSRKAPSCSTTSFTWHHDFNVPAIVTSSLTSALLSTCQCSTHELRSHIRKYQLDIFIDTPLCILSTNCTHRDLLIVVLQVRFGN